MKKCTKCGETKPLDEFTNSSQTKDGKHRNCRSCKRDARLREDPEKVRLSRARWRERNREHVNARERAYHQDNTERIRERRQKLRARNGEQIRAGEKSRRDRNPHLAWVKTYRRRARRYGIEMVIEDFTKADVIDRYGDSCFYCEEGAFEETDHVIPVRRGGPHTLDNIRPVCVSCNRAKWIRTPDELDITNPTDTRTATE